MKEAGGASGGWEASTAAVPLVERIELDDLDLLREATHPVRGAILHRLRTPRSAAELAELMDVPVTRLYHHVNKLAGLGLIQVVATRQVAAATERRYQVTARSFSLAPELFDTSDRTELALALGSLFDMAKLGLQRSIEAGLRLDDPETQVALSLGEIHLSDERRSELLRRLEGLVGEFGSDLADDDPDANHVTLFVAAFPRTS
jgi:predicted ArsR family transcriptional regulator